MARWSVITALVVAGCGAAGGPDGEGPGGGGGSGSGGPRCETVCWAPADRPVVTTTDPPTNVDIRIPQCNPGGLLRNACPPGFACTGTETHVFSPSFTYQRAVCEPMRTPIAPLVFDLPAPPAKTVAVRLDVTLNGGPWPISATAGAAGVITLTPRGPGAAVTRDLPTQSGRLDFELAPGDYDAYIALLGPSFDAARYPSLWLTGVLSVVAAGGVHLDFAGQPLSYALRLDGAPFPALADGDSATLQLVGGHGQSASIAVRGPASAPSGTVVLEPDTYRISLETSSLNSPPAFPSGTVVLADHLSLSAAATATLDATSIPVSGAVRVDGADLPTGGTARVRFGANAFAVSAAPPTRYQGRVYPGTYDVLLDTGAASSASGLPRSATRVVAGFVARPTTLDIAATTTTYSGSITVNGATPPAASSRGDIVLAVPGSQSRQFIPLPASGPAQWATRLYTGSYAVSVLGRNVLPGYEISLEANLAVGVAVTRSYNLGAGTAKLAVLDGGAQPIDATVDRGSFVLHRSGTGASPAAQAEQRVPLTGPASASILVEPGTWSVEFVTSYSYTGLPLGTVPLGDVAIAAGGTTTMTFDTRSTTLAGELRLAGLPLPPAAPGRTRAQIYVSYLGGIGSTVDLPAAGPASFSVRVLPGVYDVALLCSAPCDTVAESYVSLASGLRYP